MYGLSWTDLDITAIVQKGSEILGDYLPSLRSEDEIRKNLRRVAWHNIARGTTWLARLTAFRDYWKGWW